MQFVTSAAFLLAVYTDYLTAANQNISCPDQASVQTTELLTTAQEQIDYILGNNPRGISYMVGFTQNYPKEVHHRGASIVSIHSDSSQVACREGYAQWHKKPAANPNLLLGAVVGGPDVNDNFADQRDNFEMTEACLYNNGPLVGVLARLSRGDHVGQTDHSITEISLQPPPKVIKLKARQSVTARQLPRYHSLPPLQKIQLPREIQELVHEWQRATTLVEENILYQQWEGVWIQIMGLTWLLYKFLFRLIIASLMYGGLKSKVLFMFSKSLPRRLIDMSLE